MRDTGVGNTVSEELMNRYHVRKTDDLMVPTRDGQTHVYIHYPESDQTRHPLFINIHGGGFIKSHREQDTVFAKNICSRAACVVIDIDYTPVPDQKYPYALHQCYDVVKWAVRNRESLQIDPAYLSLCGHSAGGNLAAAVSILNNVRHDFNIALQILDYPCLDLYTPPQFKRNAYKNPHKIPPEFAKIYKSVYADDEYRLDPTASSHIAQLYTDAYVDDEYRLDPTASPLFAPSEMLTGLPETLIFTCGDDIWGAETEKYAYRLLEAGVPVTARRFLDSSHGFLVRRKDQFEEAENMIFDAIGRVFAKQSKID
ncbi:alpha/beta hydrolase [Caproiciproducens faecalis]|uniref:Alpha/beta hydrolase n=1 Tax=Caproiciproducens faecalis TaxID=2820301 RepID=A0ABS7DPF9_9FIRM|nr:alpha/beta hydrolase [Caproiciproducens faecalis]MBW7573199.1 alpha/beta hydrolase [Caproiciproducens faecalis]